MPTTEELLQLKQRIEAEYLGRPGVTGVDVGYKWTNGVMTDQVVIRIHVAQKKAAA